MKHEIGANGGMMATSIETETLETSINAPVAIPTSDETYLQRVEATLDLVDETISSAEVRDAKALAVSVVIPVYNERRTIVELVGRVREMNIHQEIILVDDYSLDGTREILLELAKEPGVRLLLHGYNQGKGAALRTAFAEVQGDVILIQDADLEYDPFDYPVLLVPIERGEADVVYGSRFLENPQQDPSWLHRLGNRTLTKLSNWMTGQNLTDMETCYKVFRREVLEDIRIEQNRFGFEPEITAKISSQGYRIREAPIFYHSRGYDEGKKIRLRDALKAVWCILKYRRG
jgi:glycosyltransferase involved in cell wall biosynthesis